MLLVQCKKFAAAVIPLAIVPLTIGFVLPRSRGAEKTSEKDATPVLIRSAQSGAWSAPATWEGGKVPAAGNRVQVRSGHTVVYDGRSSEVIRSLHLAGVLTFAHDKDTQLDVGLLKIQAGDDTSEEGFDCNAHLAAPESAKPQAALEVGSPV